MNTEIPTPLPLPDNVKTYPEDKQKEIMDYLNSLTELQKIAYNIAYSHLESSFDILRSNGFKDWKTSADKH